MKTLIIYSDFQSLAKFAIIDGDYSRLDGTIMNAQPKDKKDDKAQHSLSDLMFDPETGRELIEFKDKLSADDLPSSLLDVKIINVGFIP